MQLFSFELEAVWRDVEFPPGAVSPVHSDESVGVLCIVGQFGLGEEVLTAAIVQCKRGLLKSVDLSSVPQSHSQLSHRNVTGWPCRHSRYAEHVTPGLSSHS